MWQADWTLGLIGGLMIGVAAVIYLAVNGRILGASGIIGGLADGLVSARARATWSERAAFIAGLMGAPALAMLVVGAPATNATTNIAVLIAGGLLVGIGTRIGNGCTSGHGVCGMSRLSVRSIVATLFYVFAGGATMLIARHLLGFI